MPDDGSTQPSEREARLGAEQTTTATKAELAKILARTLVASYRRDLAGLEASRALPHPATTERKG
jgi:hypothetical protein